MAANQSQAKPPPPSHVSWPACGHGSKAGNKHATPAGYQPVSAQSKALAAAVVPYCRHVVRLCLLAGNRRTSNGEDENDLLVSWNKQPYMHIQLI